MKYSIRLTIAHHYNQPAANSRHLICVVPKTIAHRQHLTTRLLEISPTPDARSDVLDFFGNIQTACSLQESHSEMAIRLACHVEMVQPLAWFDLSPTVAELRTEWEKHTDMSAGSPLHFLGPTRRLLPDKAISDFARDVFNPAASAADNVIRLGQAIQDVMTFDATATNRGHGCL